MTDYCHLWFIISLSYNILKRFFRVFFWKLKMQFLRNIISTLWESGKIIIYKYLGVILISLLVMCHLFFSRNIAYLFHIGRKLKKGVTRYQNN